MKEYTTKAHGLHYHILYFTDKELNYSRLHKRMPSYSDINIQLVKKSDEDIERVLRYMNKTKKSHKKKSKSMSQDLKFNVSIFDFKIPSGVVIEAKSVSNRNDSKLKVIPKLTLFDFNPNSE